MNSKTQARQIYWHQHLTAWRSRVPLDLYSMASTPIMRHIKIIANATPYDPDYTEYFAQRAAARRANVPHRRS